jgi:hypothetical protein
MNRDEEIQRMQKILLQLGISIQVIWIPNEKYNKHGEIQEGYILIYDVRTEDAWATFIHEILEYKIRRITEVYRTIINSLISIIEKTVYE